jgi:hypothetical protein
MLKDVKSLEIYDEIIAPYKGDLEIWYTENNNLLNYFVLIISTIVAVIFGTTKFLNYLFPNLPVPSKQAKELLK